MPRPPGNKLFAWASNFSPELCSFACRGCWACGAVLSLTFFINCGASLSIFTASFVSLGFAGVRVFLTFFAAENNGTAGFCSIFIREATSPEDSFAEISPNHDLYTLTRPDSSVANITPSREEVVSGSAALSVVVAISGAAGGGGGSCVPGSDSFLEISGNSTFRPRAVPQVSTAQSASSLLKPCFLTSV